MSKTHTHQTPAPAPDAWRDVWSDDREVVRVSARIAEQRESEQETSEWLAACRAAVS